MRTAAVEGFGGLAVTDLAFGRQRGRRRATPRSSWKAGWFAIGVAPSRRRSFVCGPSAVVHHRHRRSQSPLRLKSSIEGQAIWLTLNVILDAQWSASAEVRDRILIPQSHRA
jgi:hypothetical protein